MKMRRIITVGLIALVAAGAALLLFSRNSAQTALEETRRALRQQGFKIDLAEFDLSASAEFRARAAALTNAGFVGRGIRGADYARRTVLMQERPDFMAAVGTNAALVVWRLEKLPPRSRPSPWLAQTQSEDNLWPALREILNDDRARLDAACEAAQSGPIRFNLVASNGTAMLLPHLAALRNLTQILGTHAVLELRDGNKDAAWTNLLASTRLVTAWDPEPCEVSHSVRFGCASLAYEATWQVLQTNGWADDRLALLQHEWESADFFRGLPETAAFSRAGTTALCQRERQGPLDPGYIFKEVLRSPRNAWYGFIELWRRIRYRHQGSYEDENALLLYYRDRELQLRRVVQSPTWSEMRSLPGVTNLVPFQSKYRSRMQALLNVRQMALAYQLYQGGGRGQGLLGRAAEAEARRRLLMAAIALERYRGRHGGYPDTLQALIPELLQSPPIDFMDGQPLRYRLTDDGHFVLYSVGLNCIDDGGKLPRRGRRDPYEGLPFSEPQRTTDLVWPRPASAVEVQAQQAEDERQVELARAAQEERQTEAEQQAEVERQAAIETLLTSAEAGKAVPPSSAQSTAEPTYQGRPLNALLRNEKTAGTNRLTLNELLTPRQITTGGYEGTATFEVPVSFNAVTSLGKLHLVVDGHLDVASRGEEGERQTCERATNGNCWLGWTTTYDPPGKHAIQAEFIATKDEAKEETALKVQGPAVPFVSTNLCQFNSAYDHFDARGATLYARLPESNGVYAIELKTPAGAHIRTLKGTTTNGVINVHWDLLDDHGQRFTNDAFDSVFQVTLPASGRSQTLKGP
jgi:hypothetical protein